MKVLGNELRHAPKSLLVELRRNIGYIFQAHNLLNSLTARQNVQMSMELHNGLSESDRREKACAMLASVGLGEFVNYYPNELSVGQKQRVAIARALVSEPKIILADEPTASLDKKSGRDVVDIMQSLAKKQGSSVVMVTHDNRILDVADRLLRMEDGKLSTMDLAAV